VTVVWSNWCLDEPIDRFTLSLRLSGWPAYEPVAVPDGGVNSAPCSDDRDGPNLSVSEPQLLP
jgi:hypothetical protein